MPAKAPIYLKSTNSKKGKKCRLRDILSPDMISPPLGDFRHTIHIGKGGERDAFGDMSFLQGKFELLPGKGRGVPASDAQFTETPSPVLKNAHLTPFNWGLPGSHLAPPVHKCVFHASHGPPGLHDRADELEILEMETLNGIFSSNNGFTTNGNGNCNGFGSCNNDITLCSKKGLYESNADWVDRDSGVDEGRICDFDFEFSKDKSESHDSISNITGSLLSLELDLGPSILDDVLNIMGDPKPKSRP
uniref:CRIB domain-containing protein n=1 Tax=Esox lucius TaxID=8010 RepID=A0AAY5K0B4_ESOLU